MVKTKKRRRHRKRVTLPEKYSPGVLREMDHRTAIAQRLQSAYTEITNDLGGVDSLSRLQRALVERFIYLESAMQSLEAQLAEDPKAAEHLARWVQMVNALSGLAARLGLKRRKPPKTVDLETYVKKKTRKAG